MNATWYQIQIVIVKMHEIAPMILFLTQGIVGAEEMWQANEETAEGIIHGLEAAKNSIPPSDRARKEYSYILLREYGTYVKDHTDHNR